MKTSAVPLAPPAPAFEPGDAWRLLRTGLRTTGIALAAIPLLALAVAVFALHLVLPSEEHW